MAGEWPITRFGDIARVIHGFAFDGALVVEKETPDVLMTPGNFEIGGGFKRGKFKYYKGKAPSEYILKSGDVVITMTDLSKASDTLGYSALVPAIPGYRFLHNQRIGKVEILNPTVVDKRFLYWVLRTSTYRNEILASSTGTSIKHTAPSRIEAFCFHMPPLPEQRAISHILGTLDDKIELNRRMNETLEAMARALFKSWFVDFDPVRAKAEGRDPGLPKPLADLFPDSFEDSELCEIPRGWEVRTLADFASLNPESWSKETRPEIINYVDLSNTKWGSIETVTDYAQQDAPSRAQRVLRSGDTIVGTVRPGNGSYAFISADGLTGSTGFAVLRPLRPEFAQLIYLAATAAENIEALAHLADGGAYPAVRPEVVISTQAIRPSDKVLARFSMLCAPLLEKIAQNERESYTLAAQRDALLPKLISGELRIEEDTHILERVP